MPPRSPRGNIAVTVGVVAWVTGVVGALTVFRSPVSQGTAIECRDVAGEGGLCS